MRIHPIVSGFALAGALSTGVGAQTWPEITGKVVFGWQGWHNCPGDQKGTSWFHWSRNGAPTPTNLVVDMYPDLSEFDADELCAMNGFTIGGKTANLFSARHPKSVDRHFKWMKEYGLDGVLVQRFLTEASGKRQGGDVVLKNAMDAARTHGRVFAIEYDLSGHNEGTLLDQLKTDWTYLVDQMKVTEHPGYLRHKGKPVLAIWGMGLNDGNHPPATPAAAATLVKWFRQDAGEKYRVAYLGGVPSGWRTRDADAFTDAGWNAVYDSMDIVQPWTVGRYVDSAGVDRWKTQRLDGDVARAQQKGRAYQPVVWPGFSWKNLNAGPENQIPRKGGSFLWRQAVNAKRSGAPMLKIAMFDEVDEATAMYKLAAKRSDAPAEGFWLTLDADGLSLPSDWYLRVANVVTRMFRNEITPTDVLPLRPGDPLALVEVGEGARPRGVLRASRAGRGVEFLAPAGTASLRIHDLRGRLVGSLATGAASGIGNTGVTLSWGSSSAPGLYHAIALDASGRVLASAPVALSAP